MGIKMVIRMTVGIRITIGMSGIIRVRKGIIRVKLKVRL